MAKKAIDGVYSLVRDAAGKLVPTRVNGTADEMLDEFRAERRRAHESLGRMSATARTVARGLRRSDSQQKLKAVGLSPPPPPDDEPEGSPAE